MRYFNTFGGNPVAIAAAQATLDVLRDEGLVENARAIGDAHRRGVRAIGDPRIGEVRGAGLFIGVDLVDAAGAPSEALALDVVNGLRDRRVLLSATAFDNATLKIRPPLVFDEADADRLLTELAAVLRRALRRLEHRRARDLSRRDERLQARAHERDRAVDGRLDALA